MNRLLKYWFLGKVYHGIFWAIVFIMVSCSPSELLSPMDDQNQLFFKQFDHGSYEFNYTFVEEKDGNILLVGSDFNFGNIQLSKTNNRGTEIWNKTIEVDYQDVYTSMNPQVTPLFNGYYFVTSIFSPQIFGINQDGNENYRSKIDQGFYEGTKFIYGKPFVYNDSFVFIGAASGYWSSFDVGAIYIVDILGRNRGRVFIGDLGGRLLSMHVYQVDEENIYLCGTLVPGENSQFSDPRRVFIAKYSADSQGIVSSKIIDFESEATSAEMLIFTKTENQNLVYLPLGGLFYFQGYIDRFSQGFQIVKVDNQQNLVWKKRIDIGALRVVPASITSKDDGGFLVSGWCIENDAATNKPFMAVISAHGELLFSKIFKLGNGTQFRAGKESRDGNYLFSGFTRAFGNTPSTTDIILLKANTAGSVVAGN